MSLPESENILFQECIESLSPDVTILSREESANMWKIFKENLPIVYWGRIDWEKIENKIIVESTIQTIPALTELTGKKSNLSVYIFWNDACLPVIKTSVYLAITNIDDITCVAPDTWFLNLEERYIIEFFHEGEITIGLLR